MTTTTETELLAGELAASAASPANLRRNGKIARLPKETRDMLNHMLDDGLPYRIIIDELGEAGQGLNTQNITNWVQGGYQDYLKHQDAIDRAKAQVELAIDLLREIGDADIAKVRRACNYVAALQLFETMRDHGDETLKKMLQARPAKYLNVIHTLCHQSNSSLKLEKHRLNQELLAARTTPPALPSSSIKPNQAPGEISTQVHSEPDYPASVSPANPQPSPAASSQIKVNQAPTEISTEAQSGPVTAPVHHSITPSLHRPAAIHQSTNPSAFPSSQIKVNQASARVITPTKTHIFFTPSPLENMHAPSPHAPSHQNSLSRKPFKGFQRASRQFKGIQRKNALHVTREIPPDFEKLRLTSTNCDLNPHTPCAHSAAARAIPAGLWTVDSGPAFSLRSHRVTSTQATATNPTRSEPIRTLKVCSGRT